MPIPDYHVVYLTGAPATGKSSLTQHLAQRIQPLTVFTYSRLLADHISQRQTANITERMLREESAYVVTREDVARVDTRLIETVRVARQSSHVIIDSHAVTKERYGFRVTPFSLDKLRQLGPTMLICLYADSSVVRSRISENSQGRPLVAPFEADLHTNLQAAVALIYGIELGIPIYFVNSSAPKEDVARSVMDRMSV